MAVAWMLAAGDWFDTTSRLTAVVTLGGHHLVVLWLAAGGLALFAATALMSRDLTEVTRLHTVLLGVAGIASAVALGGAASVVALVVGALLLTALVGRALLR
jgi:hypothetical protein